MAEPKPSDADSPSRLERGVGAPHSPLDAAAGRVEVLEEVVEGLDAAPAALVDVLAGRNVGKLIIRVRPDPGEHQ